MRIQRPQPSKPAEPPVLILDGFLLPPTNTPDQLNSAQLVRVEVLKDVTRLGLVVCKPFREVLIVSSRIPWVVPGRPPRIYANQKAARRRIGKQLGDIRLLTVAESAGYGAEPGTQLVLVTLKQPE